MNELTRYFESNRGRLLHKWHHYFDIYDHHFSRFRNTDVVILEIGVSHGGSLQMWKEYFGDKARIYGVDVNPDCKKLEEKNIEIFIGSQSDRAFLRSVASRVPPIDILIDDGGHKMSQQIATFEELFSKVKPDGVYLCEDSHTSYRLVYGGGHERNGTFIEYSKRLIDALNAYHSEQSSLKVTEFTKTVNSIHFYDSVVVIEKKARGQPTVSRSGEPSLGSGPPDTVRRATVRKAKYRVLFLLNATLRALDLPGIKWR